MKPSMWVGYCEHMTQDRISEFEENAGKGGWTIFGLMLWKSQRRFLQRLPWCAVFVHAVTDRPDLLGKAHPGTRVLARRMRKKKLWRDRGYDPVPGDIIFMSNSRTDRIDHCGIVERADELTVTSVEGNATDPKGRFPLGSGGVVARNVREKTDPVIVGYGAVGGLI